MTIAWANSKSWICTRSTYLRMRNEDFPQSLSKNDNWLICSLQIQQWPRSHCPYWSLLEEQVPHKFYPTLTHGSCSLWRDKSNSARILSSEKSNAVSHVAPYLPTYDKDTGHNDDKDYHDSSDWWWPPWFQCNMCVLELVAGPSPALPRTWSYQEKNIAGTVSSVARLTFPGHRRAPCQYSSDQPSELARYTAVCSRSRSWCYWWWNQDLVNFFEPPGIRIDIAHHSSTLWYTVTEREVEN